MSTTELLSEPQPLDALRPSGGRDRGLWSDAWRRLIRNRLSMLGMIVLIAVVAVAFLAVRLDTVERYDAREVPRGGVRQSAPTSDNWFGTDQLGRDNWSRVLAGVRASLQVGLGTQLVVLTIGLSIGALAALGGRLGDTILMRATDVMFAFPELLFIILVRAVLFGRDWPLVTNPTIVIILSIGLVNWTVVARLVRGQMLSLRERDFVVAARALGAPPWRVVLQHMLPNTLGPVIVAITFGIPAAIFAEASLGFIGLGLDLSLGSLVSAGYNTIQRNVWNVVFPAAAIAILMLSFTFIGDGLRDALDPRTR